MHTDHVEGRVVDVDLEVQRAALGGEIAGHGAHREPADPAARQAGEDRQAARAGARLVAAHLRPGVELHPTERELVHGDPELTRHFHRGGLVAVGDERLLHHDHVGVEVAQHALEVEGLAHPVAARPQPGVAVEADEGELGHGCEGSGRVVAGRSGTTRRGAGP